jgi:hypothetical protein
MNIKLNPYEIAIIIEALGISEDYMERKGMINLMKSRRKLARRIERARLKEDDKEAAAEWDD